MSYAPYMQCCVSRMASSSALTLCCTQSIRALGYQHIKQKWLPMQIMGGIDRKSELHCNLLCLQWLHSIGYFESFFAICCKLGSDGHIYAFECVVSHWSSLWPFVGFLATLYHIWRISRYLKSSVVVISRQLQYIFEWRTFRTSETL